MNYIVCQEPGTFLLKEQDIPQPKAGESLLRIRKIGICGTDIHAFGGTQPYFNYPRVLGHELAAEYVQGDAKGFEKGDAVSFIPYFNCGSCVACRNGLSNCCTSIQVFGVHIDGGMAEYVVVPDSYLLHGEGLDFDELALVEPLAIAAHGVRRAGVKSGETVLVMGAGPIGIGLIQFAQQAGAKVIALDVNAHRLDFCKKELGVWEAVNPMNVDVMEHLAALTDGDMPTVVIDATGNRNVMNSAFQYLAHGGRYVLVGLQKGELVFSHPEFHKRESTLMSSRNATREDFQYVIDSIKSGKITPKTYITHRIDFKDLPAGFENLLAPENNVIKALVEIQ
ncbi:zinc-binding alcohol dehydrogenase family protein [Leeuwenhoekiella aestuarii]|uniref:2-desacetyl-2-hydroxyethyl bacteriochlorophyllide A dehydrogenase n=1 Tax=Leeuwenhoekiella aestuarii TaxID=2249426 RepID=A0A4Q0NP42_9FLAO|nr:zinc-binding alcohol dehydrogenase family protein [Leeuwenhoekiella aestuarii]RXG11937.1 2-desacetyl-2-hydroxyethyl bacteriochlorophyllide A dehydrogenase [Leeuwenhoekiella aestuarii]